jgi:hypothetical protein
MQFNELSIITLIILLQQIPYEYSSSNWIGNPNVVNPVRRLHVFHQNLYRCC